MDYSFQICNVYMSRRQEAAPDKKETPAVSRQKGYIAYVSVSHSYLPDFNLQDLAQHLA